MTVADGESLPVVLDTPSGRISQRHLIIITG
jgi:hypothetical protein